MIGDPILNAIPKFFNVVDYEDGILQQTLRDLKEKATPYLQPFMKIHDRLNVARLALSKILEKLKASMKAPEASKDENSFNSLPGLYKVVIAYCNAMETSQDGSIMNIYNEIVYLHRCYNSMITQAFQSLMTPANQVRCPKLPKPHKLLHRLVQNIIRPRSTVNFNFDVDSDPGILYGD